MVRCLFPSVGGELKLEQTCPHGHRGGGRIHSAVRRRPICDIRVASLAQQRMHCAYCGTSWTVLADARWPVSAAHWNGEPPRVPSNATFEAPGRTPRPFTKRRQRCGCGCWALTAPGPGWPARTPGCCSSWTLRANAWSVWSRSRRPTPGRSASTFSGCWPRRGPGSCGPMS